MDNEKYSVTGMSCAACSAHVEKAVKGVKGVTSVAVSLLTNSMTVSYDEPADSDAIVKAVEKAGYGAFPSSGSGKESEKRAKTGARDALEDRETPVIKKRLISSLFLLIPLLYLSMGHNMLGWPVPEILDGNLLAVALAELLLAAIVMIINNKFFVNGFKGLVHGGANMDSLVAMGSLSGFVYSTAILFLMTEALSKGDAEKTFSLFKSGMYFESSAMILTLISVGKMLEAKSKGRTTDAIKSLMDLSPKEAHVIRGGAEITVAAEDVLKGDIFIMRPGESFPVDGKVIEGESAVNEAALTGESLPVDKEPGSLVSAATINQNGFLKCEALRVGSDTTLSKIIDMVSNAAATKAPVAKIADRVSGVFVPAVMCIALAVFVGWMISGSGAGFAIGRGISVLVISCPCALGLATPVAIMVGSGLGAKHGILFKTAASLEATGKAKYVILDKTGTLTEGKPKVTEIIPAEGLEAEELLAAAASLEDKSEHPLAAAICERAKELGLEIPSSHAFEALPGHGVKAILSAEGEPLKNLLNGQKELSMLGGNASLMERLGIEIPENIKLSGENFSSEGKTPLYFAANEKIIGLIAVADVIKPDSKKAVAELKAMGIRPVMLTGDNKKTALSIAGKLGIEAVVSDVLPGGKEAVVRKIREYGTTAMVGDGINDAPALTRADVGIAIGAGADVAIDAADVVLMKSSLSDAAAAIRLSRRTLLNIHENLFWAFFYNAICIPVAAGAFVKFGLTLNPMLAAAAMSMSSFFVVSNALRLNLYDPGKEGKARAALPELPAFLAEKETCPVDFSPEEEFDITKKTTEDAAPEGKTPEGSGASKISTGEKEMKKEIKVGGMMCEHCVMHVEKALKALDGVTKAKAFLEEGKATVDLSKEISNEALKEAITAAGYDAGDVTEI